MAESFVESERSRQFQLLFSVHVYEDEDEYEHVGGSEIEWNAGWEMEEDPFGTYFSFLYFMSQKT